MASELDEIADLMPLAARLGISWSEASPERVGATLNWAPELCTAGRILHGGALMTLADSAGALVAFLGLAEGEVTATMTSNTQLFRPVTAGSVRAVAEPLNPGRSAVAVQTSLYDDDDRLVAQTTQIQMVRAARVGGR